MALRTLPDAVSNAPVYNRRALLRQYTSGKQLYRWVNVKCRSGHAILPRCCVPDLSVPFLTSSPPFLSLSFFAFLSLSCPSALFNSTLFTLDLLAITTNYPYLSPLTFLFCELLGCLFRFFASPRQFPPSSESDFFASDVPGFTKCRQSSFLPASHTPFSHHQCIRCCGQHYQLQHLCHWNHRSILKSVSVPPSTRDVAF
jgi:hypothetical protein